MERLTLLKQLDLWLLAANAVINHYLHNLREIKAHPESAAIDFAGLREVMPRVQEALLRRVVSACLVRDSGLSQGDIFELKRRMSELNSVVTIGLDSLIETNQTPKKMGAA